MRRRTWISSIAIITISVSTLFALYAYNSLLSSQGNNTPSNLPTSDVAPIGQYYLSRPPYFPNNSDKITKIFLENATLRYDYSNVSFTAESGYNPHRGVPAVVINAKIRNDYSVEEIIQSSQQGIRQSEVWLDVYLYDKEGDIVGTLHRGNPLKGSVELKLKSGETASVNLVFATQNRIDYFEIYVSYLLNVQL